jgi:hypothetical protein
MSKVLKQLELKVHKQRNQTTKKKVDLKQKVESFQINLSWKFSNKLKPKVFE